MKASKGKVLVAMSGGVDSSVAAGRLLRDGYEVVGCFMRLGSPGETLDEMTPVEEACEAPGGGASGAHGRVKVGHQGCCSITDAADARLVAAELGIPLYVCNFKKDFGRVIDYFVDEYAAGRTPNPCVRCNDWLKFGKLHEYAKQIGAGWVASGHYARIGRSDGATQRRSDEGGDGNLALMRGVDHAKDQSYVLFGAPRGRLAEMMLPIGGFEKSRVREMAREFGLPVFDKPDSQEICFVPDNDYAGLVERRLAARGDGASAAREGAILDESGAAVGTHAGQHRFTIGQRRGVGVALGHPIYVIEKDARANTITVGTKEMLLTSSLTAREVNWLTDESEFADWRPARAQIRAHGEAAMSECRVDAASGTLEVRFDAAISGVAPGQAVVCYDAERGERVLGGGWIAGRKGTGNRE